MATKWKQVAIHEDTYERLIGRLGERINAEKKRFSLNDIIKELLDTVEPATAD